MKNRLIITAALAAVFIIPAHGQGLGLAGQFNAFISGNATTSGGESEGAIAVGGNWTATNGGYNVDISSGYSQPTIGTATNIGAYVGGNLSLTNGGHANNGSSVYYGGTYSPNGYGFNGGGSAHNTAVASNITSQFSVLKADDNAIAALGISQGNTIVATSDQNNPYKVLNHSGTVVSTQNQNININLNASGLTSTTINGGRVFVINIDEKTLTAWQNGANLTFSNIGAKDSVLVNVTDAANPGGAINFDWHQSQDKSTLSHILYNFGTASTVSDPTDSFEGSILAPNSTYDQLNSHNVEGNLIAANWNLSQGAELHLNENINGKNTSFAYNGYVPQAVPEPVSLISLGLGAVALLRKRKNA